MSVGVFFWALSATLLILMGMDVVNSTGKYDLVLIALGLIPLGLIFSGYVVPISFGRRRNEP